MKYLKTFVCIAIWFIILPGCKDDDAVDDPTPDPIYQSIEIGSPSDGTVTTKTFSIDANIGLNTPLNSSTLSLDLNEDGIMDYDITTIGGGDNMGWGGSCAVKPLNNNQVVLEQCVTQSEPIYQGVKAFTGGEKLDSTGNFQDYTALGDGHVVTGNGKYRVEYCWPKSQDVYVGVRFFVDEVPVYGWIKLNANATNSKVECSVKSFGFRK